MKKIEEYLEATRITLFRLKSDLPVKEKALLMGYTEERIDDGMEKETCRQYWGWL